MEEKKKRRSVVIQSYTLKDLCNIYNMSRYRLLPEIRKHVKEIGERIGNFYQVPQVRKIFQLIPLPSDIDLV